VVKPKARVSFGQSVEERAGQALRAEDAGPFVEVQVAGDDGGAALVALGEHLKQQLGSGLRQEDYVQPWLRKMVRKNAPLRTPFSAHSIGML